MRLDSERTAATVVVIAAVLLVGAMLALCFGEMANAMGAAIGGAR